MKAKIAQFCLGNKQFLLLPFYVLILTALVIGFTPNSASAATPPPPKCEGWADKDLPPCIVPEDSIEILYKSCDDTIINKEGEVVGGCGQVLVKWNSPAKTWTKEQLEAKDQNGKPLFKVPSEWEVRWSGNGNGANYYSGDTGMGAKKLETKIQLTKKCGDVQLKVQIEALCECPKAPGPECGNPEFCNPFIDVLKGKKRELINGELVEVEYERKFNLVNGQFVESKDGSGVSIPADIEDRELVRKGATIAGLTAERAAQFCKAGNYRNLTQGKDCSKEPCAWECVLNGIVKKCKKTQTIACDGPNGDYVSNPYLEPSTDPNSPYQQAVKEWLSKYSNERNPWMGGWYNLCLINGKPTNKCANASLPISGGKKTWTCGEAPDQVNCAACIKPACAKTLSDGNKYNLDDWKKLDQKTLEKMLCKDGTLVKGPEAMPNTKPPRIYWDCRAYCDITNDKGIRQKSFTTGCNVYGEYCGDGIVNGKEQCEKDADCGTNAKCLECQCCPNAECGRDTTHTFYDNNTDKMYYLPEPRCINGEQVWDPNPPSPWKFMDYWDEANRRTMQYKMWVREDKGWGTAATAAWTCKSKCSDQKIDCSFDNQRCGDGVLKAGEQCEKGIACADGSECKMCKCGPHHECDTDKDCKAPTASCYGGDGKSILRTKEKCEAVNGIRKCVETREIENCSDRDGKRCGLGKDWDKIFHNVYTCFMDNQVPSEPYCGLAKNEVFYEYCNDGLYCNGQERCIEEDVLGKATAVCLKEDPIDCSKNTRQVDTCDYAPDSNPFTRDVWYYVSKCEEKLVDQGGKLVSTGYKCSEDDKGPSHTCDVFKCGASCSPENNDAVDGRNPDCILPPAERCQGKKTLSPPDPYGTCVNDGSINRSCACDFSNLKFKCAKNSCGAVCSEGATQKCGPGLKGTQTCDKNTCGWGACIVPYYCGDGTVNKPDEQCELPGTLDNINCNQSVFECRDKHYWSRDDKGNCNASCGCVIDPFMDEGCSDQCGGDVACNGKNDGDQSLNGKYCLNCMEVDCTTDSDCTDKYSCNSNNLWSAKQKCVANKCQIDPASAKEVEKCNDVTYSCDVDENLSEIAEKCVIDNPDKNGLGDSGRCEPQAPKITPCKVTMDRWSCENPNANVLTHYVGKCNAALGKCEGEEAVADKKDCNYNYTNCEGNDVYEYYGKCNLGTQSCEPEDKTRLETCEETKECQGDEVVTTGEICGDLPSGDKGCVATGETRLNCADAYNGDYCGSATEIKYERWTCDTRNSITDCFDVSQSESCAPNDIAAKNACGDPLPPPVFGWPDYNPFKRYVQPAWTSQCEEADPNDLNGDRSKLPSCLTCNPEQSGSACEMTSACSATCGADAECDTLNVGDACGSAGGICTGECKCEENLACGNLHDDNNITNRWTRSVNDWPMDGGAEITTTSNPSRYCVGADRITDYEYTPGTGNAEWTWTCEKTGEPSITCYARELGCGLADAQRFLDKGQTISFLADTDCPAGSCGAHQSIPDAWQCGSGSYVKDIPADSEYGKWIWTCIDPNRTVNNCSARRQCESTSTVEAVYYNSAQQCWTVDDEKYNNSPSVEWPDALFCGKDYANANCGRGDSSIDYYSLAQNKYNGWGYWDSGNNVWMGTIAELNGDSWAKDIHGDGGDNRDNPPQYLIIQEDHRGICPEGFVVPSVNQWTKLRDAVYDDGNPTTTLRDVIAFNAQTGGYWTKTSPNPNNYPWHNSPRYFDDLSGEYEETWSPDYITGDYPDTVYTVNSAAKHLLRCIQPTTGGGWLLKPCVGRGCFGIGGGGLGN